MEYTDERFRKTKAFLNKAFGKASSSHLLEPCPCSKCANRRRINRVDMGKHLVKNGYMPGYTRWIYHGEAHRTREEVVRPRVEAFDDDAGVPDLLDDVHQALGVDEREKEEMEAATKAFYEMMNSAQKPLYDRSSVSELDAIGRLMALKSELNISRDGFDKMLIVIGTLLPEGHILPKCMYDSQKLLRALKIPYEQIYACPKGCVLFWKEHVDAKYFPKCESSRYLETDSGDGQKSQTTVPVKIVRRLPFLSRIQRLFMNEESAKQMTWHKNSKWYNPNKMVHPSDGEAWTRFNDKHRDKADEAHNVHVVLQQMGSILME